MIHKLDESKTFLPLQIAVLTVSDTRDLSNDTSGQALVARIKKAGHKVIDRTIVPDDANRIEVLLRDWILDPAIDVVISNGGTGVTGRDVTPEAFERVIEKRIDGFGELFRMLSYQKIGTSTIQSRALAGVAGGTYLFALPGSTGAVKDGWDDILVWQLDSRHQPCNLVELMPRLKENLPQPRLKENLPQPRLKENLPQPRLKENLPQPRLKENLPQPRLKENLPNE